MEQTNAPPAPNLGAILLQQGKITAVQLAVGLHLQQHSQAFAGCRIGEILIRCGFLREDDLIDALALQPELIVEVTRTLSRVRASSNE